MTEEKLLSLMKQQGMIFLTNLILNEMNKVKYSIKYDVFVCSPDEDVQISNMDIVTMRRKIAGFVVFRIVFGWHNDKNPLYKIQQQILNKLK